VKTGACEAPASTGTGQLSGTEGYHVISRHAQFKQPGAMYDPAWFCSTKLARTVLMSTTRHAPQWQSDALNKSMRSLSRWSACQGAVSDLNTQR
jgi:hypothetical protein